MAKNRIHTKNFGTVILCWRFCIPEKAYNPEKGALAFSSFRDKMQEKDVGEHRYVRTQV